MQILIFAVGKGRNSPEQQLAKEWLRRLPKGGKMIEVESKLPAGIKRTADEGVRLIQALPAGAALAILDPKGKDHSSEDLADLIDGWRNSGFESAVFAIGGADGHADMIRKKALKTISFGQATWPHLLVRAMLAEQLYRATTILMGHPYHRGN